MNDCPFCEIIRGESSERILTKGEYVFTVLSNPRLVPGHLLVIPKRHIEKPSELTAVERKELLETVIAFQEKILQQVASGCDIRQNCRPFLPQSRLKINHLHFHLLPREFEDDLYSKCMVHERAIFQDLPQEEEARFGSLYQLILGSDSKKGSDPGAQ